MADVVSRLENDHASILQALIDYFLTSPLNPEKTDDPDRTVFLGWREFWAAFCESMKIPHVARSRDDEDVDRNFEMFGRPFGRWMVASDRFEVAPVNATRMRDRRAHGQKLKLNDGQLIASFYHSVRAKGRIKATGYGIFAKGCMPDHPLLIGKARHSTGRGASGIYNSCTAINRMATNGFLTHEREQEILREIKPKVQHVAAMMPAEMMTDGLSMPAAIEATSDDVNRNGES